MARLARTLSEAIRRGACRSRSPNESSTSWPCSGSTAHRPSPKFAHKLRKAPSHNTVATILTILENKGRVAHAEDGRAFRFRALVGREEAGRSAFTRLVDTVFAGSAESLIMHFVRDQRLTKAELERLRALLDEHIAADGDDRVIGVRLEFHRSIATRSNDEIRV